MTQTDLIFAAHWFGIGCFIVALFAAMVAGMWIWTPDREEENAAAVRRRTVDRRNSGSTNFSRPIRNEVKYARGIARVKHGNTSAVSDTLVEYFAGKHAGRSSARAIDW